MGAREILVNNNIPREEHFYSKSSPDDLGTAYYFNEEDSLLYVGTGYLPPVVCFTYAILAYKF